MPIRILEAQMGIQLNESLDVPSVYRPTLHPKSDGNLTIRRVNTTVETVMTRQIAEPTHLTCEHTLIDK